MKRTKSSAGLSVQENLDETAHKQTKALLEQRARQLALLNEIGRQVAASLELEGILDTAVRLVQQGFGYHHVALFLLDPAQGQLVMRARAGSFASIFPDLHSLRLDQGMVGWVARHGEKLLANEVSLEPHYWNPFPELLPTCSELSMPIRVGDEIVGVLDIQSPQYNAFDENDVRVMEILADQVAVAIQNARLYQEIQQELAARAYAEKALLESEKRYRTLVETSPSAIFYLDMHARVSLCNRPAARMFGFEDPQAMIGMDVLGLVDLPDRQMLNDEIPGRRAGYIRQDMEVVLFRKDGARFPAEVSLAVVGDDAGVPAGIIGVVHDLTEHKRLEQYRLRAERLAVIGSTAAILAHEIKNPLQSIQSNLELVLDYALDTCQQEEHLRLCAQELERLVVLTNRLLSLAQAQTNASRPISIDEMLQMTKSLIEKRLPAVQMISRVTEDLPLIDIVPEQIVEVLLSLVGNIVASVSGNGPILLAAGREAGWVTLSIGSEGRIIPLARLKAALDSPLMSRPPGVGQGFSVYQSIVQQLGGELSMEEPCEQGCSGYILHLPVYNTAYIT